jgi:hypothetical protein
METPQSDGPLARLRKAGGIESATRDLDELAEPLEPAPDIEIPSAALARLRRHER